jgi:hypothetical protein
MYVFFLPPRGSTDSTTTRDRDRVDSSPNANSNNVNNMNNNNGISTTHSPGHQSRPSRELASSIHGRRTPGLELPDSARSLPSSHRIHFAMVEDHHHIRKSETLEFFGRLDDTPISNVIQKLRQLPSMRARDGELHVSYRLAIEGVDMVTY